MSFKDRFKATKAAQDAKRLKQEAKQKAAEEKERKKLEDPKYKAKMERKAEQARIAEEKRLVKVDIALTEVFNRLMKDDGPILKAVEKNNGVLEQKLGGFNTVGQYCKKGGGLLVEQLGDISAKQIEKNKTFQKYKEHMAKEGFDIVAHDGYNPSSKAGLNFMKGLTGSLLALTTTTAILVPPLAPIALVGVAGIASNNVEATSIWIKIKEKPPVQKSQNKEQEADNTILDEINQQVVKQPEKVPAQQRNIIK